jgi:hypothetical protein
MQIPFGNDNKKGHDKGKCRFPSGMTMRRARQTQIPFGMTMRRATTKADAGSFANAGMTTNAGGRGFDEALDAS